MSTPGSRCWVSLGATCTAAGLAWLAFADLGVAVPAIVLDGDAAVLDQFLACWMVSTSTSRS